MRARFPLREAGDGGGSAAGVARAAWSTPADGAASDVMFTPTNEEPALLVLTVMLIVRRGESGDRGWPQEEPLEAGESLVTTEMLSSVWVWGMLTWSRVVVVVQTAPAPAGAPAQQ